MGRALLAIIVAGTVMSAYAAAHVVAQTGNLQKLGSSVGKDPKKNYKAWVFLTVKPDSTKREGVSPRALLRRAKAGFKGADILDAPVHGAYWRQIEKTGATIRTTSQWFNAVSVEATGDQLNKIADFPFVLRIERVRSARPEFDENVKPAKPVRQFMSDSLSSDSLDYGLSKDQLEQIGVIDMHRKGFSGKGVVVALLDDGCRWTHEAFRTSKIQAQWDFVMKDNNVQRDPGNPKDYDDGHGTMTLSALGGYAPGRVIGPAYEATFLLARTEDGRSETPAEEDYWIAGVEWAEKQGADIVSSSLGYRKFDNDSESHTYESLDGRTLLISRAANVAAERGMLIVNAMGNDGPDGKTLAAPADAPGVFSVGAVNRQGEVVEFSSRGPAADGRVKPDVVARGYRAYVATNKGYGYADGTSFATPLVAGAAALLIEAHPDWTLVRIRDALSRTASRADRPDNDYGFGIVNVAQATDYRPGLQQLATLH